ncbi:MAG: gliding motility lipoprotein GldH [Bacteroidales bacterium]
MKRIFGLSPLLVLLLLISCDPDLVYDHFETMEDGTWSWTDPREFKVEVTDTLSLNNIYLQVRHTVDYPMSNLYMFVYVKSPSGQMLKDTVNIMLAEPDGRWIGKGLGNLRELMLLYRRQTRFGEPGIYTFTLEQGMRNPSLPVTDIGIRIERTNQKNVGQE